MSFDGLPGSNVPDMIEYAKNVFRMIQVAYLQKECPHERIFHRSDIKIQTQLIALVIERRKKKHCKLEHCMNQQIDSNWVSNFNKIS